MPKSVYIETAIPSAYFDVRDDVVSRRRVPKGSRASYVPPEIVTPEILWDFQE